jgi:dihydrofolate reductase
MRRIRYSVAMSLDGYIAGPKGEFDWIKRNADFDFSALFKQFDTILAGRGTFEPMAAAGRTSMPGMKTIIVSTTLRAEDHPDVAVVNGIEALTDLKAPERTSGYSAAGSFSAASLTREWLTQSRFPSCPFS